MARKPFLWKEPYFMRCRTKRSEFTLSDWFKMVLFHQSHHIEPMGPACAAGRGLRRATRPRTAPQERSVENCSASTDLSIMTAEVNAPAAACPHAAGAASKGGASDKSCGFGSQMMDIARHAAQGGAWEVTGSSGAKALSQEREVSSIPRSDFTPAHQSGASAYWEYPSEEMYFKAMKRKGWDPEAEQMKTIVAIHNTVNEQSWREVMQWEAKHGGVEAPKLKRFIGRPTDFSPKARMLNLLGWSVLPFDRHDWIVERADGTEVRYVIDFYSGQPEPGKPLSVYLDVRPALDSVESVVDRLRWQFDEKIKPLLPFRGVLFDRETKNTEEKQKAPASSNEGRSTVIPRNDA